MADQYQIAASSAYSGNFGNGKIIRSPNGDLHEVHNHQYLVSGVYRDHVKYSKSIDNGINWTSIDLNSGSTTYYMWPDIAVDSSGNLHVVTSVIDGTGDAVYYMKSIDGGTTWSAPLMISHVNNSNQNAYLAKQTIAVDGNDNLRVIIAGNLDAAYRGLWYAYYDGTWHAAVRIYSFASGEPQIAIDSNNYLHVVFSARIASTGTYRIRYLLNNGSWQTVVTLSDGISTTSQFNVPKISIDSTGKLHLVFERLNSSPGCYYILNNGTWQTPYVINASSNFGSDILIGRDDHVHVFFMTSTGSVSQIEYISSWGTPAVIFTDAINRITITSVVDKFHPIIATVHESKMATGYSFVYFLSSGPNLSPFSAWIYIDGTFSVALPSYPKITGIQSIAGIHSITF